MLHLLVAPLLAAVGANAQVTATFPNGATNPSAPAFLPVGSYVNQTSYSRLLTLNGVDDFCLFGPPEAGPDSLIGNVEPIVVAYCTKPRNNARLIPDGTITSAHFIRTPLYVQIHGMWDGTKVNIPSGDAGGELDPHGAENVGNPIGGNVTTNVPNGRDVFYEEWMSFISYNQYCMRICTAQTANVTTALQCEHELDIMGCQFVMAIGDFYTAAAGFTSCDGDAAAPPGLYPQPGGGTSTFRQRYTGTFTANGSTGRFTVGQTVTPSAPAFYPSQSNCFTYSTISNGVNTNNFLVTAAPSTLSGGSTVAVGNVGSTSQSAPSTSRASSASSATTTSRSGSAASSGTTTASVSRASGASASGSTGAAGSQVAFSFPTGTLVAAAGAIVFGAVAVFM